MCEINDNMLLVLNVLRTFKGSAISVSMKNNILNTLNNLIEEINKVSVYGCAGCKYYSKELKTMKYGNNAIGHCEFYNQDIPNNEKDFLNNGCNKFKKED